jgi:uncharacterized membrane protein
MNYVFVFALGIGFAAGLRSLTPPAVVAWAAHLGWLSLRSSPLAFMGSTIAVVIFSLLAVGELISDLRPSMPKRTAPAPLVARILTGALCGACVCAASNRLLIIGAILGAIGGVIGAFAGYEIRRKVVAALNIKDHDRTRVFLCPSAVTLAKADHPLTQLSAFQRFSVCRSTRPRLAFAHRLQVGRDSLQTRNNFIQAPRRFSRRTFNRVTGRECFF